MDGPGCTGGREAGPRTGTLLRVNRSAVPAPGHRSPGETARSGDPRVGPPDVKLAGMRSEDQRTTGSQTETGVVDGVARPLFSVVVPAHDEGAVLRDRLGSLVPDLAEGEAEIVVVANGCTDDTADVARSLPGVRVLELDTASKAAALDAGDRAVTAYPRVFLDADVRITGNALRRLVAALDSDRPVVASPRVAFDTRDSSWPVRAFHDVFAELPYVRDGLVGLGVYAVSRAGRERFGSFPDVVADDLFIQTLFERHERVAVDASFEVVAPRTVADLLKVRTRVVRGNREIARRAAELGLPQATTTETGGGTMRSLAGLVARSPRMLPAALVYLSVVTAARLRAARTGPGAVWERDASSRTAPMQGSGSAERVLVDGVPVDPLTEGQVVAHVVAALEEGRGGSIVTPNVDIHRRLRRQDHRDVLDGADLVVPDGMPLIWASRLAGRPLPERVTGASLLLSLSRAAAAHGRSIFLLGAAPGVAATAAARLTEQMPGLAVAGWASPPWGFEESAEEMHALTETLLEAEPDLVFVALGFPRQERLMIRLREVMPATWFLGCGASIDFVAGRSVRAPRVVQALGMEWAFRLAQEPRRLFRRYVVDGIPHAVAMLGRAAAAGARERIER